MPKMRNNNDSTVLSPYLHCHGRRNAPRIHHRACEENCKKYKQCPYYGEWYRENYGKELEGKKTKTKKKKVVRRTKKKVKKKKSKAKAVKA